MESFGHILAGLAAEVQANPNRFESSQRLWARLFAEAASEVSPQAELDLLRISLPAPFALSGWYAYFDQRATDLLARADICNLDSTCIVDLNNLKKRSAAFGGIFRVVNPATRKNSKPKGAALTIGIDLRPLSIPSSRNRGIGRYLINTLPRFIEKAARHKFVLLTEPGAKRDEELLSLFQRTDIDFREFSSGCDHDLDLFLLTDPTPMLTGKRLADLPVTQCAWMSLVYDFIPLEYPELYLRGSDQLVDEYLSNIETIAERCQAVFPISRYVATQCEVLLNIEASRVLPIFGGVDESFFTSATASTLREFPEPYYLYVGGADARKNLAGLIKAFAEASSQLPSELKLVLVGEMSADKTNKLLRDMRLEQLVGTVVGLGSIDDVRLRGLYANALATVFVSHSEGLGLPALEAMATGCPVIASKTTALGETVGSTGVLVDPASTSEIAHGMIRIAKDSALRKDLALRGPMHARKWRWDDVASTLLEGIEKFATREVHCTPRTRRMRVAMMNRENVWSAPGGDSRIMLQMQDAALQADVEVFFPSSCNQANDADIIHFVNMTLPAPLKDAVLFSQERNIPLVVTTLYEDWPQYINASHQAFGIYRAYMTGKLGRSDLSNALNNLRTSQAAPQVNVGESLRHASLLLACAESEAARLASDFSDIEDRIHVVPFEVNVPLPTERKTSDSLRYALGFDEFVLCIGRLETRKNQLAVLAALQDEDIPIVFAAGGYTPQPAYANAVRAWRRKAPVTFVDRMPWHLMSALIRSASTHVLPSFYELPGLVHLECAAAGVPVVAGDWGAITDYLPDSLFYACDPLDLDSIRLATLNALSAPLAPAAADIAQSYTRERLTDNLIASYERALKYHERTPNRNKQYVHRPYRPEFTGGIHAAV